VTSSLQKITCSKIHLSDECILVDSSLLESIWFIFYFILFFIYLHLLLNFCTVWCTRGDKPQVATEIGRQLQSLWLVWQRPAQSRRLSL